MRFVGLCVPRWSHSSPARTGGQLSCCHALMRVVQGFARETRAYCAYHEHVSCIYRWMDVTLLGGMSLHRVLICPMYIPRLLTERASAHGLLWRLSASHCVGG